MVMEEIRRERQRFVYLTLTERKGVCDCLNGLLIAPRTAPDPIPIPLSDLISGSARGSRSY